MAWLILLLAGLTEIAWAVGLKRSDGFTRLGWSVWSVTNMVLSLVLLTRALRDIPLGTAYAVWTGIGAAGTGLLGIVLFGEPFTAARLICIALIIAGIAGLRVLAPG